MQIKHFGWHTLDSVLLPIPSHRLDDVWPQVETRLKDAVNGINGRMDINDLIRFIKEKDWVLWVSVRDKKIEAIACTEIIQYPKNKMCMVRIMTGENYANWIGLEAGIAAWAESIGCAGMESWARLGWKRVFKNYECSHILLERLF